MCLHSLQDLIMLRALASALLASPVWAGGDLESTPATAPLFYMYEGAAFPSPDELLACRGLQRLAPFGEPMAQFYAELGLHRLLAKHPRRVRDPEKATLFYIPLLAHMDQDAGQCNGQGHKARMQAVATALLASPHWHRRNGTDHVWTCTCVMMHSMLTKPLWALLANAAHAVHSVPRHRASPSHCTLAVPYYNPTFALVPPSAREPGLPRPTLAHFRGRVMNRVRSQLVKRHAKGPGMLVAAAHASTAARCNLNKCRAKAMAEKGFSATGHFTEMTTSLFCLVPVGDSPPSSRLYLALAAGCIPVFLSDFFEGAFAQTVRWADFTLRFKEAEVSAPAFNLSAALLEVAADRPRVLAMQRALRAAVPDVLYEVADSRVGDHFLRLAHAAVGRVCATSLATNTAAGIHYEREPPKK